MDRRKRFLKRALRQSKKEPLGVGSFPSAEEVLRDDRSR
jgi:hypothetical protein